MKSIGDIDMGRPNLGNFMPVYVYRLFELSMIDILGKEFGQDKADEIVRTTGLQAGMVFAKDNLDLTLNFDDFIMSLQKSLSDNKIGILRIEHVNLDKGELLLSIYEDLDCSGLPVYEEAICVYDEGFISGILEAYTGIQFKVKEIDCWGTGDRACRFIARSVK